ncbi:MAG: hypothetical protein ACFFCX_15770 [Candidatus Sifarchaeia archaeon]
MEKRRVASVLMLFISFMGGSIYAAIHSIEGGTLDRSLRSHQTSQTSEYPPFEPPASNASTFHSGFIWVNGQEIFWRYFFPNTSQIQPLNFIFSFEIWWENPDTDIVVVVELSENEGEQSSETNYTTLLPYEKVLEMPNGDFIHYAIWMNSTYFFANETWASFGNELIDDESLNLSVGIQHDTYFPIFEYTISRDTSGPSIQIIHPNYDELENKLILDWSNTSFQIVITSLSYIKSVTFIVTFLNQTTLELQDVVVWNGELLQDPGTGTHYVPSLITEKIYPDSGGLIDIDTDNPLPASFVVIDGYGYETSKSMNIFFGTPYSNASTTTPSSNGDWEKMVPIVGSVSVVGVIVVLIGIRRIRK